MIEVSVVKRTCETCKRTRERILGTWCKYHSFYIMQGLGCEDWLEATQ